MSHKKKQTRAAFRNACFLRDGYRCVMCDFVSTPTRVEKELDAHHIHDRSLMPFGGYVPENGASLCAECHELAEVFHFTGTAHPGYAPEDLFQAIGSSYDQAYQASLRLGL